MATVVNTETLAIRRSVDVGEFPPPTWEQLTSSSAADADAIPARYRKWTGSAVAEMTPGEKSAVDAAAATAADDGEMGGFDRRGALAAFALLVLEELNTLRAEHGLSQRTPAQLKSAIRSKMESI